MNPITAAGIRLELIDSDGLWVRERALEIAAQARAVAISNPSATCICIDGRAIVTTGHLIEWNGGMGESMMARIVFALQKLGFGTFAERSYLIETADQPPVQYWNLLVTWLLPGQQPTFQYLD